MNLKTFFATNNIQHTPYYLILLLIFNMLFVTVATIGLLYQIGFNQQKNRLVELVETQASMIEIVAKQEINFQEKFSSGMSKDQIA